jgi:hypothetical protein
VRVSVCWPRKNNRIVCKASWGNWVGKSAM